MTLTPQPRFRWAIRQTWDEQLQVLQQAYTDTEGKVYWRDVPIVEEERTKLQDASPTNS